jgi:hypothetical protein
VLQYAPTYQLTEPTIVSVLTGDDQLGCDRILRAGTRFAVLRCYAGLPCAPELERLGTNPKFYKIHLASLPAEPDEYLVIAHLLEQNSRVA